MTNEAKCGSAMQGGDTAPKVSVIVPCYNVEKFVRTCLESLKKQTLHEIEFIVVNDGSTDKTSEIIQAVTADDDRFVVLNKKNSGYGDSVNRGMALATGNYIGIIESDDWVEPEMFEILYENAEKYNLDISRTSFFVYENGADHPTKGDFIPCETVTRALTNKRIFRQPPAVWSAIYRRAWLLESGIKFRSTPGASFQDISFSFKTNLMCQRLYCTKKRLMHYRIHGGNSVRSSKAVMAPMEEYAECFCYAKKMGLLEKVKNVLPVLEYASYKWNYLRVDEDNAHKFFEEWRKEWQELTSQGISFFSESFKVGLYSWMIRRMPDYFEKHYLAKKRH